MCASASAEVYYHHHLHNHNGIMMWEKNTQLMMTLGGERMDNPTSCFCLEGETYSRFPTLLSRRPPHNTNNGGGGARLREVAKAPGLLL